MPYEIQRQDHEYCVVKQGSGDVVKCHPTKADAMAHMRALYANVPDAANLEEADMEDFQILMRFIRGR